MKLSERLAELNAKGEYPGVEEIEAAQRLETKLANLEFTASDRRRRALISAVGAADLQGVVDE